MNMIGNKYRLFGTNTIFEIEGDDGNYWIIKVYDESDINNVVNGVQITKQDLQDSSNTGNITLV